MKDYIQTLTVFIVFLALIPCLVFVSGAKKSSAEQLAESSEQVKIYFTEQNECTSFTMEEYITGAVLAQMPADFEEEALKAQAVLAKTYIEKRQAIEKQSPTEELHGGDISDDTTKYQGFFTEEQAKDFYGDEYEAAYNKVNKAAKEVMSYTLTYEGEPVIAAFHAVSSGYTESAETAWGQNIPYLQAVESPEDAEFEQASVKTEVTAEQFRTKLSEVYSDIEFTDLSEAESWLEITEVNERGYVTSVSVCGREIPADEFIEIFEISSPCFTADFSNTKFTFSAKGYGHLVGMSQYGANAMALKGADFKEILLHYYTDCEITED